MSTVRSASRTPPAAPFDRAAATTDHIDAQLQRQRVVMATVLLRVASTICATLAPCLMLVAAFFHAYHPIFPLRPVMLSSLLFHSIVPFGTALSGKLETPGFSLFQPLTGGAKFIARQCFGYFMFSCSVVAVATFALKDLRRHPTERRAVLMYAAALLSAICSLSLSSSLKYFQPPPKVDDTSMTPKSAAANRRKEVLGSRFVVAMLIFLSWTFALVADSDPDTRAACMWVALGLHAAAGGVTHFIVGWRLTPGYRMFMPFAFDSAWRNAVTGGTWAMYCVLGSILGLSASQGPIDAKGWDIFVGTVAAVVDMGLLLDVIAMSAPSKANRISNDAGSSRGYFQKYAALVLTMIGVGASIATLAAQALSAHVATTSPLAPFANDSESFFGFLAIVMPAATMGAIHALDGAAAWHMMRDSPECAWLSSFAWGFWIVSVATAVSLEYRWSVSMASLAQLCLYAAYVTSRSVWRQRAAIANSSASSSGNTTPSGTPTKAPARRASWSPGGRADGADTAAAPSAEPLQSIASRLFTGEFLFACGALAMSIVLRLFVDWARAMAITPHVPASDAEKHQLLLSPGALRTTLLSATLFWLISVPCVHLAGRLDHDEPWFAPFRGTVEYVAMQAVGWTLFGLTVLLSLITPVDSCLGVAHPLSCTMQGSVFMVSFVVLSVSHYFKAANPEAFRAALAAPPGGLSSSPSRDGAASTEVSRDLGHGGDFGLSLFAKRLSSRDRQELLRLASGASGPTTIDVSPALAQLLGAVSDMVNNRHFEVIGCEDRITRAASARDGMTPPLTSFASGSFETSTPLLGRSPGTTELPSTAAKSRQSPVPPSLSISQARRSFSLLAMFDSSGLFVDDGGPRPRVGTSVLVGTLVAVAAFLLGVIADVDAAQHFTTHRATPAAQRPFPRFTAVAAIALVISAIDALGLHAVYGRYLHGRFGYRLIMAVRGGAAFVSLQVSAAVCFGIAAALFAIGIFPVLESQMTISKMIPNVAAAAAFAAAGGGVQRVPVGALSACGVFAMLSPVLVISSMFVYDRRGYVDAREKQRNSKSSRIAARRSRAEGGRASPQPGDTANTGIETDDAAASLFANRTSSLLAAELAGSASLADDDFSGSPSGAGFGAVQESFVEHHAEALLSIMLFAASWAGSTMLGIIPDDDDGSTFFAIGLPFLFVSALASLVAVPLAAVGLVKALAPSGAQADSSLPIDAISEARRRGTYAHYLDDDEKSASASNRGGLSLTGTISTSLLLAVGLIGPVIMVFGLHFIVTRQAALIAFLASVYTVLSAVIPVLVLVTLLAATRFSRWPEVFKDVASGAVALIMYGLPALVGGTISLLPLRGHFACSIILFLDILLPSMPIIRRTLRSIAAIFLGIAAYRGIAQSFDAAVRHLAILRDLPHAVNTTAALSTTTAVLGADEVERLSHVAAAAAIQHFLDTARSLVATAVDVALAWEEAALLSIALLYLLSKQGVPERDGSKYSKTVVSFFRRIIIPMMARYFSLKVVDMTKTKDEREVVFSKQCIYGLHPHGMFPATSLWATKSDQWLAHVNTLLRDVGAPADFTPPRICVHAASVIFRLPVLREIVMAIGGLDVTRPSIEASLRSGFSPLIVPGGQAELVESISSPKQVRIVSRHKGFLKLGIQHGAPLVPLLCHGEDMIFRNVGPKGLQKRMLPILSVPFPMIPIGRWWLPLPAPARLTVVVGRPIFPQQVAACRPDIMALVGDDDRKEEYQHKLLAAVYEEYYAELKRIFDATKEMAGFPGSELKIVDPAAQHQQHHSVPASSPVAHEKRLSAATPKPTASSIPSPVSPSISQSGRFATAASGDKKKRAKK